MSPYPFAPAIGSRALTLFGSVTGFPFSSTAQVSGIDSPLDLLSKIFPHACTVVAISNTTVLSSAVGAAKEIGFVP